ncbi:MAG: CoA activase, partial [Fibrobacteria bacterium]|nr:CoA activase [Fibrobacteria bacterium]
MCKELPNRTEKESQVLWMGVDIGSTTVKAAVIDPANREIVYSKYLRHYAEQALKLSQIFEEIPQFVQGQKLQLAFCGSGGKPFADYFGVPYIQEVVANALAIKAFYPQVLTAMELGGQDAKAIFFQRDQNTGMPVVSDMRMNGSCAGGTGAFLDQISELIDIPVHQLNEWAKKGRNLYPVSGRCGVFAKTDIQPLLNQGVSKEDIVLSTFHALANQAIAGLTQGLTIQAPMIFEGGPCAFNSMLINVFKEKLKLDESELIIPENSELLIAMGASLYYADVNSDSFPQFDCGSIFSKLNQYRAQKKIELNQQTGEQFFPSPQEKLSFLKRHESNPFEETELTEHSTIEGFIGIDAGSTTSKFVLIDENAHILHSFYENNNGDPIGVLKKGLLALKHKLETHSVQVQIKGLGVTGYGENLVKEAFCADYSTVETVAHAQAAKFLNPDVTFILDIGGQDMKAIFLDKGVITQVILNEACSAGCGSFLETFSRSLSTKASDIAEHAFASQAPSQLGSRCTVFMNSCIITEQRNGKSPDDIMAGLCRSVIENVFTKVVRLQNRDSLGEHIVVQGGTFKNNAVLRAFEQYLEREVMRPSHPHLMGALGVALGTRESLLKKDGEKTQTSRFIGFDALSEFTYQSAPDKPCGICQNNCTRTVMRFSTGGHFVTGNRCEKGDIIGDVHDKAFKEKLKQLNQKMRAVPDMFDIYARHLRKSYPYFTCDADKAITIGLPMVLDFWRVLPFWKTVYQALGFKVVISNKSTYSQFEKGLKTLASDTVCFPAKLVHGHIEDLIEKKVDRIFLPMMIGRYLFTMPEAGAAVCPVVQGYPIVIDKNMEPEERHGIPLDYPTFDWKTEKLLMRQVKAFLKEQYAVSGKAAENAIVQGLTAQKAFHASIHAEGQKILNALKDDEFAVVI